MPLQDSCMVTVTNIMYLLQVCVRFAFVMRIFMAINLHMSRVLECETICDL